MLARLTRAWFPPERLNAVVVDVRATLRAHPHDYDRRLRARFLFTDRTSGEAVTFTVAEEREALGTNPAEPTESAPRQVEDYDLLEAMVSRPREHALFAEFASRRLEEADDRAQAIFLLESESTRKPLVVTITERPAPHEMEYFFLHDALFAWASARPIHPGRRS